MYTFLFRIMSMFCKGESPNHIDLNGLLQLSPVWWGGREENLLTAVGQTLNHLKLSGVTQNTWASIPFDQL